MSKIVGIDLGTTNSVVAVLEAGQPKVIPSSEGRTLVPSVVDVTKNIVGEVAKRAQIVSPQNTIYSIKRLMGRRFKDKEVQKDVKLLPYTISEGKDGTVVVEVEGKGYTPQEISAKVLQKLKKDAEAYLGEKISAAVITVPAYFDDSQRQATKQAGEIAGFEVKRIINEPTASALAYGLEKKKNEQIAVYDLGGGTFDISILDVGDGVFEVKSTNGDTHLGGDDFDQRVIDFLADEFKKENGIDLREDRQALQRLRDASEKAKVELSTKQEVEVSIPFITADSAGPKHLQQTLTRAKLEQLTDDLVEKSFAAVDAALADAKLKPNEIEEVILVGGQTRMPVIQERVKKYFGKEPHKGVNPDEVVAVGAAIQAGVLGGEVKDVLLLDVTPLTLGIETLGAVRTPLIDRNTTIPTSKSQIFSTAADNQTSVEINVLQGERPMAADNKSLGRFILSGIPPAPRGVPQIEVSFDIDANGILNVKASDKATGKEQKITITASTAMSKEEAEKARQDAEKYAEEDKKKQELAEAKNTGETLTYTAEKTLKEAGDKVPEDVKKEVTEKVKAVREVLDKEDTTEIKRRTEDLSQSLQKVGAAMYQQQENKKTATTETQKETETRKEEKPRDDNKKKDVKEGEVVDEDDKGGDKK